MQDRRGGRAGPEGGGPAGAGEGAEEEDEGGAKRAGEEGQGGGGHHAGEEDQGMFLYQSFMKMTTFIIIIIIYIFGIELHQYTNTDKLG
jgi:hypothetical protein